METLRRLVRYRILLLLSAIAALVISALLLQFQEHAALRSIAAYSAIVFVWANGAYWLLETTYPHTESKSGVYVSRIERQSEFAKTFAVAFYFLYAIGAIFATVICIRMAAGG